MGIRIARAADADLVLTNQQYAEVTYTNPNSPHYLVNVLYGPGATIHRTIAGPGQGAFPLTFHSGVVFVNS